MSPHSGSIRRVNAKGRGAACHFRQCEHAAAGKIRLGGSRFIGFETQVALYGQAEFAAHGAKFDEAHIAELGAS